MEVIKKSVISTGKDTDSNIRSINLDSLSDKEPQLINIQSITNESSEREVPIDLDQLVIDENGYVQMVKRELRVSVDHISGNTVVSIIDGHNKNVIREIPQHEVLAVERLITAPAGMLFRAHT